MARGSREEPWWLKVSFDDFKAFGFIDAYPAMAYADKFTFVIRLFDPHMISGSTYEAVRLSAYDLAEKAIAKADELYHLEACEFKITQVGGYPLDITLELTLSEKKES